MTQPFKTGDIVQTIKGAKFWGRVTSVYLLPGFEADDVTGWRMDVLAIDPGFAGTLHIYPIAQVALREDRPAEQVLAVASPPPPDAPWNKVLEEFRQDEERLLRKLEDALPVTVSRKWLDIARQRLYETFDAIERAIEPPKRVVLPEDKK